MKNNRASGYSGTPLAKKLGIQEGSRIYVSGLREDYTGFFDAIPNNIQFQKAASKTTDVAHIFVTNAAYLKQQLELLRHRIRPDAIVWISWPKKSANISTDVTENVIREIALPMGFVDIKVCAVNEVWSGLKLVIRKELR